jgi:hypothetical protein
VSLLTETQVDPRLKQVKSLTDQGAYEQAFRAIPTSNSDLEIVNTRAVCMMRMGKFAPAITLLRSVALNTSTFHLRSEVPHHVKLNYATALFFGGEPAGGMDALADLQREDDPQVKILRQQCKTWVKSMNMWRRLDWYFNRIAPKAGPPLPALPVGYLTWELPAATHTDQA